PGRHEPPSSRIHRRVETLQRAGTEECQVPRPRDDDLVDGLEFAAADHGNPNVPHDLLAVGHDKRLVFLEDRDADRTEDRFRKPRYLRSRIHQNLADGPPPRSPSRTTDLDVDAERSHGAGGTMTERPRAGN